MNSKAAATVLGALALLTLPAPANAATIRGTVVDRDGKPAAGAKVLASRVADFAARETREVTADDAGAFAFEAGDGGWYVLALRGDEGGHTPLDQLADVQAGKDPAPVAIRLGPPTRLKGLLLDEATGEPVPGGHFALDDGCLVDADAQGRFEAPGLATGFHDSYVFCPGYERRAVYFDTTGRPAAELELRLPKGGKAAGRVVDEQGRPIAGAIVRLSLPGRTAAATSLWEQTGDDGRFTYDGLPLGQVGTVMATAPGYVGQRRAGVRADPEAPAAVEFTLRPEPPKPEPLKAGPARPGFRNVRGTVTGPGGEPVAGADVFWHGTFDSPYTTTTDAAGDFLLNGVPDRKEVVAVWAPGLAAGIVVVDPGVDRDLAVGLDRGVTLRGRVVGDDGRPIEGAGVAPMADDPVRPGLIVPLWRGRHYFRTDRDGRFALEHMPEKVVCSVTAPGWVTAGKRPLSPTDESANVFALTGLGAFRGRVVDEEGRPVRNFRVLVGPTQNPGPGGRAGRPPLAYEETGLSFTDRGGAFTVTGLIADNVYNLKVITDNLHTATVGRVEARPLSRLKPDDVLTLKVAPPR